jgi:hypothetical protein
MKYSKYELDEKKLIDLIKMLNEHQLHLNIDQKSYEQLLKNNYVDDILYIKKQIIHFQLIIHSEKIRKLINHNTIMVLMKITN